MAVNGKDVVRRYEALRSDRMNFENRWEKLAPFISPTRYGILTQMSQGQDVMQDVFDSQGIFAADVLAKFLAGEVINPSEEWAQNIHGNKELRDNDEVREWLEECTRIQHSDLARSNFYLEGPSMLVDHAGFGTGSLFFTERPPLVNMPSARGYRGTRFHCDKIGRFLICENPIGEVDTLYRDFIYTARQARDRWGDAALGSKVKQALAGNRPDERFTFIHAIQPRSPGEKGYGNKSYPWLSCYVEKEEHTVMEESGYQNYPAVNPRWDKTPGEVYGRGPGEIALNDILTKNKARQMELEDWALKIRPPVIVGHDSVVGTLRFRPAGLMTIKRHANQSVRDAIAPFETGSRADVNQIEQEQLKVSINQAFFVDQIIQFLEMDLKDVNNYPFAKKLELLFKILGSTYGRMETEFLRPMWENHFMMLFRAGVLPPPPPVLAEYPDGGLVDVEFQNPLARAQRSGENDAMGIALGNLAPIIELEMKLYGHSETFDWIDVDNNAKETFRSAGVPATRIKSDEQVQAYRKQRAEAEQAEQQTESMMQMAEGAGKAAPMVKAMQDGKGANA